MCIPDKLLLHLLVDGSKSTESIHKFFNELLRNHINCVQNIKIKARIVFSSRIIPKAKILLGVDIP